MARKVQEEVHCDRCKRVEYLEASSEDPQKAPPVLQLALFDESSNRDTNPLIVKFDDLCGPCKDTVHRLVEQIAKRIEGKAPKRSRKTS